MTVDAPPAAVDRTDSDVRGREPRTALVLALFLAIWVVLTFPNVSRLHTYIAGDSGDSILNLWIIRRVQIGFPHGWHGAVEPADLLPGARNAGLQRHAAAGRARCTGRCGSCSATCSRSTSSISAAWVLSSWCVYRLALRFVRHWGAALVAALAYTYAAERLIHQQHFQLVVGGALVPLVLLLLLRLFDAPSAESWRAARARPRRTHARRASYFGAMMACGRRRSSRSASCSRDGAARCRPQ